MIQLNDKIIEYMRGANTSTFLCIGILALDESIENIHMTTFYRDLVIDGHTYYSSGAIVGADKPQMSSTVDRSLYKVTLADPNSEFSQLFDKGMTGASATVSIGLVDETTGLPDLTNFFIVYKGVVESYESAIDTNTEGENLFTITFSNLMASLDDSGPYYTSKSFMSELDIEDTAYDLIYEGSESITLKWGKD